MNMSDELIAIRRSLRLFKAYAVSMTAAFAILFLGAFMQTARTQEFDEITVKRIRIVDGKATVRVLMGADYKKDCPGVFFFNEKGHENGAFCNRSTRDENGQIQASSLLAMDQFENDQVVALGYSHTGDQKRMGLTITDRPDTLTSQAAKLLEELRVALQSVKSDAEAQALRRDYSSRIPAREWVARRLFAGRDVEGSSLLTLSDADGKARLRLQVDKLGKASITFLDSAGRAVRTIEP
jgi:hypothetical protein